MDSKLPGWTCRQPSGQTGLFCPIGCQVWLKCRRWIIRQAWQTANPQLGGGIVPFQFRNVRRPARARGVNDHAIFEAHFFRPRFVGARITVIPLRLAKRLQIFRQHQTRLKTQHISPRPRRTSYWFLPALPARLPMRLLAFMLGAGKYFSG